MKNIKDLSDEELIELFKKNNYCFKNMAKSEDFRVTRETIRKEFIRRGIDYNKIIEEWKNSIVVDYIKNPKLCRHCGKPIPWEKRVNNYCNNSCAASENNKGIVRNPVGNLKNLRLGWVPKQRNYIDEKSVEDLRNTGKSQLIVKSDRHNDKIDKYKEYGLRKILPGECFICGSYQCENDFCKNHNFQQLMGFVRHLGFDPTTIGTDRVFGEFQRVKNMIYDLYWNQGMSCSDIGDKFGYPGSSTITKIFEYLEIPRRTFSESVSNALLSGKLYLPEINVKTGLAKNINQKWHTTWTGESVFLRSSYEIEYAEYLDENQISYSVEELRIEYYDTQQNKTRIAIPDFYLSSTNEIVEIKSDFTLDIQEMLDKFDAYKENGYIPKLILEGKEVDIYRIEEEIDERRINKIKTKNISSFRNNGNSDIDRDKT